METQDTKKADSLTALMARFSCWGQNNSRLLLKNLLLTEACRNWRGMGEVPDSLFVGVSDIIG